MKINFKKLFKKGIKVVELNSLVKKQKKQIESLEDFIEDLKIQNDNLQLQLDKDNKIRQIKYLEKRIEEMYLIKNDLIKDKKELQIENKKLKGKK